ncbi:MAG TPA: YHS domain-containing protein [Chloroflexota bacterium]|nr:YHS domain-containing protein [Chloroflexota bacterium]
MANSVQDQNLYSVSIDGVPMVLDQMGLANEVVAQWTLGESQEALIKATPEQASRLQELLHVRAVEPVTNGLYTDRTGKWYAVKDALVIQSGSWVVPLDVLKSVSKPDAESPSPEPVAETSPASPVAPVTGTTPSRETDPVCGMVMRPGQEAANVNYQGQTYHFCSDECRKLFLSRPTDYVQQKAMTA